MQTIKVLITNIVFNEKTKEWNVTIDKLKAYKEYKENNIEDRETWSFGDFMSFDNNESQEFIIDVPYSNLIDNIGEIDNYAKQLIKQKTSRDVKSLSIREIY